MAQLDDTQLQITIGVVGVELAPVDLLIHQGRKLGLGRDELQAVPVVRFGLRAKVLERPVVVVLSALPLDILQADAVLAVNTGQAELMGLLDGYDLVAVESEALSLERLMEGAGREHAPLLALLNAKGAPPMALEGIEAAAIDLETGDGIAAAINPIVSRVAQLLATGERSPRQCPTVILHATHQSATPSDLGPVGFPKPGSHLRLHVSLHEPFGEAGAEEWACPFEGAVEEATGPHEVRGVVKPAGPVPPELEGRWSVELLRENEVWLMRSMVRAG